jgi:hypothetical protein
MEGERLHYAKQGAEERLVRGWLMLAGARLFGIECL